MTYRAFTEFPQYVKQGERLVPAYGTSDGLTQDLSDLMYKLFQSKVVEDVETEWNEMFEKFKSFWNLDIKNPWTSANDIRWFMGMMEQQELGDDEDNYTRELVEEHWNKSIHH